jgi:ribonuclease BN (tRNA processing enzyme)
VRTRSTNVLLDLGSGALANLREVLDYPSVDAVIVSHMHADHFLDLIPLRYGLKYGPLLRGDRMPLLLPPGGAKTLRRMCAALAPDSSGDFLDEVFDVDEYDPSSILDVGDLKIGFAKTRHYIDAYAMRCEHGGASIVYSADTAPCESVEDLAHACSLFICESSLGLGTEDPTSRGHLSAVEAAQLARDAKVKRLLLTHYGTEFAPAELLSAAEATFTGPCAIADDGMEVAI